MRIFSLSIGLLLTIIVDPGHVGASERRYACWGRFGPPVVSAQCPRDTSIHVSRAGLKVQKHGAGDCDFHDGDCGCEYGEAGCQMPNVGELCIGKPACRLDVTQQYINTDHCRGFSDYMFIEFDCVPTATSVEDMCADVHARSSTGFLRTPNFPHLLPGASACECTLTPAPQRSLVLTMVESKLEGATCEPETLVMVAGEKVTSMCDLGQGDARKVDTSSVTISLNTGSKDAVGGFLIRYEGESNSSVAVSCKPQSNKNPLMKGAKAWVPPKIAELFGLPKQSADVQDHVLGDGLPVELKDDGSPQRPLRKRFYEVPTVRPRGARPPQGAQGDDRKSHRRRGNNEQTNILPQGSPTPETQDTAMPRIELKSIREVSPPFPMPAPRAKLDERPGGQEGGRAAAGRRPLRRPVSRRAHTAKSKPTEATRRLDITQTPYVPLMAEPDERHDDYAHQRRNTYKPPPLDALHDLDEAFPGNEGIRVAQEQERTRYGVKESKRLTPKSGKRQRARINARADDDADLGEEVVATLPAHDRDEPSAQPTLAGARYPGPTRTNPKRKMIRHRVGAPLEVRPPTPAPTHDTGGPTKEPWWWRFTVKTEQPPVDVFAPTVPLVLQTAEEETRGGPGRERQGEMESDPRHDQEELNRGWESPAHPSSSDRNPSSPPAIDSRSFPPGDRRLPGRHPGKSITSDPFSLADLSSYSDDDYDDADAEGEYGYLNERDNEEYEYPVDFDEMIDRRDHESEAVADRKSDRSEGEYTDYDPIPLHTDTSTELTQPPFITALDPVPLDAETKRHKSKHAKTPFRSALDPIPLHRESDPTRKIPFLKPLKPIPLDEDTRKRQVSTADDSYYYEYYYDDSDDSYVNDVIENERVKMNGYTAGRERDSRKNTSAKKKSRRPKHRQGGARGSSDREPIERSRYDNTENDLPGTDGGDEDGWLDMRSEHERTADARETARKKSATNGGREAAGDTREGTGHAHGKREKERAADRHGPNSSRDGAQRPERRETGRKSGRKIGNIPSSNGEKNFITEKESTLVTIIAGGVIGGIVLIVVIGVVVRLVIHRTNPAHALKERHKRECVIRKHGQKMMMARKKAGWST